MMAMKVSRAKAVLPVMLVALGTFSACRQGMYDQPKVKPLAESPLARENGSARDFPPGVIPRGWHGDDQAFTGKTPDGKLLVELPVPLTRDLMVRGRERFDIYCAVCHDGAGTGQGMVVARGFPAPPSFHIDRLRQAPVGHFFDVITHGYGAMYSYADRVEPADRWAITAYIRALQLSQNARLEDVPAEDRKKLEPAS